MFSKGTKIKLIKPTGILNNVGQVFTIINIINSDFLEFKSDDDSIYCRMSYNEVKKYFEEYNECKINYGINREFGAVIEHILDDAEIIVDTVFDNCTIVAVKLPNGRVLTESYSCPNTEEYDEDEGFEYCMNRIVDKVWELEEYRLCENARNMNINNETKNCEECDCEYSCWGCGCDGHDNNKD